MRYEGVNQPDQNVDEHSYSKLQVDVSPKNTKEEVAYYNSIVSNTGAVSRNLNDGSKIQTLLGGKVLNRGESFEHEYVAVLDEKDPNVYVNNPNQEAFTYDLAQSNKDAVIYDLAQSASDNNAMTPQVVKNRTDDGKPLFEKNNKPVPKENLIANKGKKDDAQHAALKDAEIRRVKSKIKHFNNIFS